MIVEHLGHSIYSNIFDYLTSVQIHKLVASHESFITTVWTEEITTGWNLFSMIHQLNAILSVYESITLHITCVMFYEVIKFWNIILALRYHYNVNTTNWKKHFSYKCTIKTVKNISPILNYFIERIQLNAIFADKIDINCN